MLASEEKKINDRNFKIFYYIVGLFFIIAAVAMVSDQIYLLLLPALIYIIMLAIFKMDTLAMFCAFITPLSINLNKTSLGIGVSLPSDPLMFGLFILFWFKIFTDGGLDKKLLKHPVTILILAHLAWMLITTFTSTMIIVSLKSTLARFCYVSVNYFMFFYIVIVPEQIQKHKKIHLALPLFTLFGYSIYYP